MQGTTTQEGGGSTAVRVMWRSSSAILSTACPAHSRVCSRRRRQQQQEPSAVEPDKDKEVEDVSLQLAHWCQMMIRMMMLRRRAIGDRTRTGAGRFSLGLGSSRSYSRADSNTHSTAITAAGAKAAGILLLPPSDHGRHGGRSGRLLLLAALRLLLTTTSVDGRGRLRQQQKLSCRNTS